MLIYLVFIQFLQLVFSQFDYTENGDTEEYSNYMNHTTNVRHELFTKRAYDKTLAPIFEPITGNYSSTQRIKINIMLYYVKLLNLDAENQIFSATLELRMNWRDPRLAWKPSKFGGIGSIFITTGEIWIPDSRLSNARTVDSVNGLSTLMVRIDSNGTVFMGTNYYIETACQINANIFPFDKQNCTLYILSMVFEARYISYGVAVDDGSQTLQGNGEWELTNAVAVTFPRTSNDLEIVGFGIMLKRVPNFYIYVIALPCFIVTLLSIIGMFWSPNTKKEQLTKLSIGLTSLVSMTVLLDMLAGAIPKTQVFPLLGIYVVSCVGIIAAASVAIAVHSTPNPEQKKMKEIEKMKEAEKAKTRIHRIVQSILDSICQRHFLWQSFFQALNIAGFIVFISFWKD